MTKTVTDEVTGQICDATQLSFLDKYLTLWIDVSIAQSVFIYRPKK
ncbi:MAG: hypothetical protein PQ975_06350 [Methanobacterium sp.]|jgi:ACR3 family arsenite efflux pump ArsB